MGSTKDSFSGPCGPEKCGGSAFRKEEIWGEVHVRRL